MESSVTSRAVDAANALWHSLPSRVRKAAARLVEANLVNFEDLDEDGLSLEAVVSVTPGVEVEMEFDPDTEEWIQFCSTPGCNIHRCVHIAAVLRNYLDQIAGGGAEPKAAASPAPAAPSENTSLEAAARKANGRALREAERRFVRTVKELYRQGAVTESALWSLGWPGRMPSFERVDLYSEPPESEIEFWMYLYGLAEERGYGIPSFLQEVKPTPDFLAKRQRHFREREIRKWEATLLTLNGLAERHEAGRVEIRFRLNALRIRVEIRTDGGLWQWLKGGRFTDLAHDGSHRLEPRAASLWSSYLRLDRFGTHECDLSDHRVAEWLGVHLRIPEAVKYFANEDGEPLVLAPDPLRWQVSEPDTEDGDYRFALVTHEGTPVPKILATLQGTPTVYLTAKGIFPGPDPVGITVLKGPQAAVPSRVLESTAGLRLLERAGVEMPGRIRSRTTVCPLQLALRAEVIRYDGATTEYCHLLMSAATPDGRFPHQLSDSGWTEETATNGFNKGLVVLDRSDLAGFPTRLLDAGFKPDPYKGTFSARVTRAFPERFRSLLDQLPASAKVSLCRKLATLRDGTVAGTLRLEASEAGPDWFDLKVVVSVSDTTLTPEEIQALIAARGQWVQLGKRGWRRLEYQLTDQEESDLARIGLTPRQLSADPQRLHALQLADPAARRFLPEATAAVIERRASELKARVTPEIPPAVRAELRPYQRDGFHFLAYLSANRFGGVLADDMGLGKTLQALTWLAWLRQEGGTDGRRGLPSLVVCPKSVQDTWRAEAERFVPDLRVRVWRGATAEELAAAGELADLHVINYAQLRIAEDQLARTDFLAAILDEGQNIKNPSSQTAQVARRLRADHRLVLTGTPIENRLLDLWSLLAFAMPGVLGNRAGFHRLYDAKDDLFARPRLAARVRPFLLRRTKAQVARDLPDRIEEDLYCELEGEQKTLYRAELKTAQQHLLRLQTEEALNRDRFHLLTSLLRLRQICCHPRLLKPDALQEGAKVEALLDTLEPLMEEGEKVLVFSQFTGLLKLLQPALTARSWTHWYLGGETEDRGELVREFQEHEGSGVFLISLKAGGSGLNLTAASYVVLFDPWWNPAVENQAIDRTHRIGQTRKIMAYRLLIKDSIEEKIRALQKSKRMLAEEVLGEERFSAALTLDDLRYLLAD